MEIERKFLPVQLPEHQVLQFLLISSPMMQRAMRNSGSMQAVKLTTDLEQLIQT